MKPEKSYRGTVKRAAGIALTALALAAAGGIVLFGLFGCFKKAPEYKIDFSGEESWYEGAKKTYREGETVTLYYNLIATDTDYKFLLDGEPINFGYDDERGFVITFAMPAHDVKLECQTKNSMEYVPEVVPDILLFDYYSATTGTDGYDSSTEITLSTYSGESHRLSVFEKASPDAEETRTDYLVPVELSEKCYRAVFEYGMNEWAGRDDLEPIDGALVVLKYREGDDYVRLSSDAAPPGGIAEMDSIGVMLREYASPDYLEEGRE
ncbi:MAG: hypothetical protein IKI03_02015 [Clostridia bacterium]|nr:hypothetical protein [Clostridia bacterium]